MFAVSPLDLRGVWMSRLVSDKEKDKYVCADFVVQILMVKRTNSCGETYHMVKRTNSYGDTYYLNTYVFHKNLYVSRYRYVSP